MLEEKLKKHNKNEVLLHIDITPFASQLKPLENKLLMKIIKETKETIVTRIFNNNKDTVFATMLDNKSDLNQGCLRSNHSTLKKYACTKMC